MKNRIILSPNAPFFFTPLIMRDYNYNRISKIYKHNLTNRIIEDP